ncbi:NUDIX hydrolase [Candidatus Collierbacteria bacterium]|nr:NUDIX hydrolase [Candidatus Collierbacteria bacterium]
MKYTYIGVVLVRNDGAVLVQHRDDKPMIPEPNKWGICGGKKEIDDRTDKDAAVRELFEETGYRVKTSELRCFASDEFDVDTIHIMRKFFLAPYDGKQKIECFEGREIRFMAPSELFRLNFCDTYHLDYLRQASELVCGVRLREGNRHAIK